MLLLSKTSNRWRSQVAPSLGQFNGLSIIQLRFGRLIDIYRCFRLLTSEIIDEKILSQLTSLSAHPIHRRTVELTHPCCANWESELRFHDERVRAFVWHHKGWKLHLHLRGRQKERKREWVSERGGGGRGVGRAFDMINWCIKLIYA